MIHQILISRGEFFGLGQVVDCRAQAVRSVPDRNTTQGPDCALQAFTQALKTLRETNVRPLPIRVRQHEVKYHVVKPLTRQRHLQRRHVSEVRRTQTTRLVNLTEENLLLRTLGRTPTMNTPLKCS